VTYQMCVCVCYLVAVQQCLGGGGAQPEGRVEDPEAQTVSQVFPASFTLQSATHLLLHLQVQDRQVAYTHTHTHTQTDTQTHTHLKTADSLHSLPKFKKKG